MIAIIARGMTLIFHSYTYHSSTSKQLQKKQRHLRDTSCTKMKSCMIIRFFVLFSIAFTTHFQYSNSFTLISIVKGKKRQLYHNNNMADHNTAIKGQRDQYDGSSRKQPRLRAKILSNKGRSSRICLNRPVGLIQQYDDTYLRVNSFHRLNTKLQISSGLTFDDGDQLLVSAQKPLGMVLEEREEKGCVVVTVTKDGAAFNAGIREGDLLVAVQNADVGKSDFEEVMERVSSAPRVVNLRFWRRER